MNPLAIITLIPQITSLIRLAEGLFPGTGNGSSKKNFVLTAINSVIGAVPELQKDAAPIMQSVETIADTLVSLFNAFGWKKGADALGKVEQAVTGAAPVVAAAVEAVGGQAPGAAPSGPGGQGAQ